MLATERLNAKTLEEVRQALEALPADHASTVGIVKNLRTGRLSPQYHLVFDDFFETVHSHYMTPPPVWEEILHFNYFANDFDDPSYTSQLDDEWLTQEELAQRRQVEKPASQKAPSVSENRKEEVKVDKLPEPEPPDYVIFLDPEQ